MTGTGPPTTARTSTAQNARQASAHLASEQQCMRSARPRHAATAPAANGVKPPRPPPALVPGWTMGPTGLQCVPCPNQAECAEFSRECACTTCRVFWPPFCSLLYDGGGPPHCLAISPTPPYACLACVPGFYLAGDPGTGPTTCQKVGAALVLDATACCRLCSPARQGWLTAVP